MGFQPFSDMNVLGTGRWSSNQTPSTRLRRVEPDKSVRSDLFVHVAGRCNRQHSHFLWCATHYIHVSSFHFAAVVIVVVINS